MWVPLVLLAFLSIFAGFIGVPHVVSHLVGAPESVTNFLPSWLGHSVEPMFQGSGGKLQVLPHLSVTTEWILMGAASAAGLIGIGVANGLYGKGPSKHVERFTADGAGQGLYQASLNKLWVDELYEAAIVKPFRALARGLFEIVDRFMIDTVLVNGSAFAVSTFSRLSRWIQNGMVQRYLVGIVIGTAAIFLWTSRADDPGFTWKQVPAGVEFTAEPGHGLRQDAAVRWDFDGDGKIDDDAAGRVIVRRPGEIASRVTMFVSDPVWGKKDGEGKPVEWRKITRKVTLPGTPAAEPGATAGGVP
jgi:hypothetical protein